MSVAARWLLCVPLALAAASLPAAQADNEHDHDHGAGEVQAPATEMPRTPVPVLTAADRAAAMPPARGHPAHDNRIFSYLLADQLEAWDANPGTAVGWEIEGWAGTDLDRLWLRSEGERHRGRTEAAHVELLYGHSIAPWWDVVAGVRHDFRPSRARTSAALGIQGLAPQFFEVEATAYVGDGPAAARFEAGYQMLFTNRLILQPQLEFELFSKGDAARSVGSGLASVEAGLRLRYEITRRFAPYVGLAYERTVGDTADLRRIAGESVDDTRLIAGVRLWF